MFSRAQPQAPTAAPISVGHSVFPLYGPWKFHIGDSPLDPATHQPLWAEPSFNDSPWETVNLTPQPGIVDPFTGDPHYVKGWTSRGHSGYWGYAWYRIQVPAATQPGEKLALAETGVDDGYQVFAQGHLLGSEGNFGADRAWPVVYFPQPAMFELPALSGSVRNGAAPPPQILAFRVWMSPVRLSHHPFTGGFHYAPLLGESSAISAQTHIAWLELVRHYAFSGLLTGVFLLLTVVAASLILFDRSDRVYLWVAAAILLATLRESAFSLANWTHLVSLREFFVLLEVLIAPLIIGVWAMVWWMWFQLRRPAWIPNAIAALILLDMGLELFGEDLLYGMPHMPGEFSHAASGVVRLVLLALLVFIVARGIRQQGKEGWLVLPAVVLLAFSQFQSELISLRMHGTFLAFGVVIFYNEAADLVLAAVIALLLLRRLLLSIRRQRQMALDVKQAQEVQQVLIPREMPSIPGLAIETEYRPAREVGGDFFQIVEHPTNGSALIVAGDVVGKGLKAGMLVALLVGAIRTATDTSLDPAYVLEVLNRRLSRRGDAQATCLALLVESDGNATLANAGHMAPYLNGEPVAMAGALPLGIIEAAEPSVMRLQLNQADKLFLLSDGIAEAMDSDGNLFGFERVHDLLRTATTAAQLAAAAQAFGQEDDISIISITRIPILEHAIA
ncbi:MAG TPA: PP2C family protein-serine/threonine phosphatase [Terracidiphilus sp.]|nr:PP2C family protein-serine/threonine phosphatase [Terracidiphilus sp.]